MKHPLSTLLSQAIVAFTIEFDNEFENRAPHKTSDYGGSRGSPWLGSLTLYSTCLQFLPDEGITLGEMESLARTSTNLDGMIRWGYVKLDPEKRSRDSIICPTPGGRTARDIWKALFPIIESRWKERFGNEKLHELREALRGIVSALPLRLPNCLPILGFGLSVKRPAYHPWQNGEKENVEALSLIALLSKTLLAMAIEFESRSPYSLAIQANLLRILGDEPVPVREIPSLTGVSKESIAMAISFTEKRGAVSLQPVARGKGVILTSAGKVARLDYLGTVLAIEEAWKRQFGESRIAALRSSLEPLVGDGTRSGSPLFEGLQPYPKGWRSKVRAPETLPHFPMVLHRGGYPDGS